MKYTCPVCGYDRLEIDAHEQDYNICPCCFTEFGNDDFGYSIETDMPMTLEESWDFLSKTWIKEGMKWHSIFTNPPTNWKPEEQLKNIKNK